MTESIITAAHVIREQIVVLESVPAHESRAHESTRDFDHAVTTLKALGHVACWVCGATEDIQYHHFGGEKCESENIDYGKMLDTLRLLDPYGIARAMTDTPLTTVDDPRNLVALCRQHHIEQCTGIHMTPFPIWILQRVVKDGVVVIPNAKGQ